MSDLFINGGKKLKGEITIPGAKNSVLPLLAAAYLCEGKSIIHNCPFLTDVLVAIKILESLGCKCKFVDNTVEIDATCTNDSHIPNHLMQEMRSSIFFTGAIASKTGKVNFTLPGGCELGPRPIDLHIEAMKKLGADFHKEGNSLSFIFENGVVGNSIYLKIPSVGVTENIILASAVSNGKTTIFNAAKEPEIVDLACFLNKCGANILGAGSDKIIIVGSDKLKGCEHSVVPDRIVASTIMYGAAVCGNSKIKLNNIVTDHLISVIDNLSECGCEIEYNENSIIITSPKLCKNFNMIKTQPYPGFPTDAGPFAVSLSSVSTGTGVFIENIFQNRFKFIEELKCMGANIITESRVAIIKGVRKLWGAEVSASDLRGGAALIIAGLCSKGLTIVHNCHYVDRGYEHIENMFDILGADITRV